MVASAALLVWFAAGAPIKRGGLSMTTTTSIGSTGRVGRRRAGHSVPWVRIESTPIINALTPIAQVLGQRFVGFLPHDPHFLALANLPGSWPNLPSCLRCGSPALAIQSGAMPLSVSSLTALAFFDRWVSPMPRSTFAALVNWMLS